MSALTHWLDRTCYPKHGNNWDDEALRQRVLHRLRPTDTLLDIGAGAGRVTQMNFRGVAYKVIGIDPDPRVASNPHLDEGHIGFAEQLPFESGRFDVVVCDNVLEHLQEPANVLAEVHRVLKPGGLFLGKTTNKMHYMPLAARLSPTSFHRFFNRLRGRPPADTFPTLYRINSPNDVRRYAEKCGFQVTSISLLEGRPEYLRFSFPTYVMGLLYERLVNSSKLLANFRVVLIVELQKSA